MNPQTLIEPFGTNEDLGVIDTNLVTPGTNNSQDHESPERGQEQTLVPTLYKKTHIVQ